MTDPVQNTFDHARSWSVISTPVNANTFLTFLKIRGGLKKGGQNTFFCFCYRRTQALRGILKATEMLSPAWILTPIWNNWVRTFVNILMGVKYIMSTAKTGVCGKCTHLMSPGVFIVDFEQIEPINQVSPSGHLYTQRKHWK